MVDSHVGEVMRGTEPANKVSGEKGGSRLSIKLSGADD
jgi:hypothetical protein